ncbi:GMC oxidoreductase [Streptomyces sp. NPDC050538]|uniref:GMC oxidoreductase n=1 Tax=Streptomyces sp. NPDC050538 TaxID=3365627 RepID=UPI003794BD90
MAETLPGFTARDDEEIVDAALDHGRRGHHVVGIRPARPVADDLVDARPRPGGTAGLRIVDRSALPGMLSRDLNTTITAMAGGPPTSSCTRADPAPTL